MNKISDRLTRKTINDRRFLNETLIEIETPKIIPMKKIIAETEYRTNGEILIVVKDVDSSKITLDSNTTEHIIIKALTKVFIRPSSGKIDEFYDEIFIDWGACVEFYMLEDNWYIVSSDGLKLE
jgi:3-dehydroquinate synthase class II